MERKKQISKILTETALSSITMQMAKLSNRLWIAILSKFTNPLPLFSMFHSHEYLHNVRKFQQMSYRLPRTWGGTPTSSQKNLCCKRRGQPLARFTYTVQDVTQQPVTSTIPPQNLSTIPKPVSGHFPPSVFKVPRSRLKLPTPGTAIFPQCHQTL